MPFYRGLMARYFAPSTLNRPLPGRMAVAIASYRRGGRRWRIIRRALALLLVLAAGVLAIMQQPDEPVGTSVYAATRDLPIGHLVAATDFRQVTVTLAPQGALLPPETISGHSLASAVRRGEILTDVRLVDTAGPQAGPGRTAVPVRAIEPAVAALLAPGMHVALFAVNELDSAALLTDDAIVLWTPEPHQGERIGGAATQLVVLSVANDVADTVAAAALSGTIGVRFA